MNALKEFDLLLLSEAELSTKNVKEMTSPEFLTSLKDSGKMLAMV